MRHLYIAICCFLVTFTLNAQQLKTISYSDGVQKLNGLLTTNKGNNLPGVLILPAWKGIDEEAKNAAIALEKSGYKVFIADIYGEGNIPIDNTAAAKIAGQYKNDYKSYQRRISLALDQLKNAGVNPQKLAIIGYCFGGTGALEAARAHFPVNGVVSIHGGLGKDNTRTNEKFETKILIENPADDKGVTPEIMSDLIKEMNDGNADWQIITYAHSKHTFTDPKSPDYNKIMADRAWQHTLLFLKELFQ